MKKLLLMGMLAISSCKTAPKAETAVIGDPVPSSLSTSGTTYQVDGARSTIQWVGTKPTGRHYGSLLLKDGSLVLGENTIMGGSFIIDINSLSPIDQKPNKNEMLRQHLLSDDFFNVLKFPFAQFEITSITPQSATGPKAHIVTGNLRLKDVEKSISFPASIVISQSTLTADASFNFDRTLFNMNYGNDKSLGNWFIHPDVNIKLHLVATKS